MTTLAKSRQRKEIIQLYLDIALDGIILHDTNQYLAARLNQLRRFIQAQGLYREQIGNDLMWRWQEFPGLDWSITWETLS